MALTSKCMQASGRAARVLSYLLADNDQCKETLLAYLPHTSNEVETGVATTGPLTQFLQVISAACNGELHHCQCSLQCIVYCNERFCTVPLVLADACGPRTSCSVQLRKHNVHVNWAPSKMHSLLLSPWLPKYLQQCEAIATLQEI